MLSVLFRAGKQRLGTAADVRCEQGVERGAEPSLCVPLCGDIPLVSVIKSPGQNPESLNLAAARCVLGTGSQDRVLLLLREA